MNRAVTLAAAAAIAAAGGAGWYLTRQAQPQLAIAPPAIAEGAAAPLYYRDPDGKPLYSPTPKKNWSRE